ncbi:hypothetical protein CR513_10678, partial [Mucuna pruriens]
MKHMFLEKFFLATRTMTIKKEIGGIRQHPGETLHEYWERFNKLYATCPHHQISLTMMDWSMIDAASGGALMDEMLAATRHLISNMTSNTQQFGIKGASQSRMVNEISTVDNLRLANQLTELTSLVRQLAVGQHQPSVVARVCGVCTFMEHPTDMCPTLQETESDYLESVGAISARAEFRAICSSVIRTCPECTSKTSMLSTTDSTISSTSVPSTATTENASSSEKELPQPALQQLPRSINADSESDTNSQMLQQDKIVPLPCPTWTISTKNLDFDEELLRMFQKVEINIPLLDAIKQIPKYAKFLKELCVHKRKKMKGSVEMGALPKKYRDPKIFTVPCTISDCTFADALLDLGASINVMPTSIYKSLNFGDLEPTRMTIQLVNRAIAQPLGIPEDVLVQVNELIFPEDFYVLDMEDETSEKGSTLILG